VIIANVTRNPWGKGKKGNWEGAWSDGSKEFTPEAQQELNHKFGNDSVFWISYQDLLRKYQHFDRTRLFMDSPDWRLTQKWISVEVPWKAEFEQKFRIVLKKESPVVLVLSQLDDRYFDGLQGQYNFRLQFRLHEVDSPGEQDYIVRSHGNYLMERSVVTELKTLGPGTYSVFIMVVADRDTSHPSVEDVVKAQCRRRVDNDKLAQVGMAYDVAHSKGAVYMESKAAKRKAIDKAKARESRIATRRKNWEKRHLSREIVRKQEKKNIEKREAKDAKEAAEAKEKEEKEAAEAKEKEEKEPKDRAVQTEDAKEVKFEKEDKAMQTEEPSVSSTESDKTIVPPTVPAQKDTDKGVQTDDMFASFTDSQGTPETPKSSSLDGSPRPPLRRIPSDAISGRPPPPPPPPPPGTLYVRDRKGSIPGRHYTRGPSPRQQYIESDGESSASPISEIDDMYSDDDPTLKPRPMNTGGATTPGGSKARRGDSEDEDEPEPWNAVCIVGFRVYSKDEGLDLRIYEDRMEDEVEKIDIGKEDDGTDGDVEDAADETRGGKKEKKGDGPEKAKEGDEVKEADLVSETKVADSEEAKLPIRPKDEELVLVDDEKKALALGSDGTPGESKEEVTESIVVAVEPEEQKSEGKASEDKEPGNVERNEYAACSF
jgi:hypothetical protein